MNGTTLKSSTSFDEVFIRTGHFQFKYARIFYSHLLLGPVDTPATLIDLKTFDFYVQNSREIVRVLSTTGAAHSKSHVGVDAHDANEAVSEASDDDEQP